MGIPVQVRIVAACVSAISAWALGAGQAGLMVGTHTGGIVGQGGTIVGSIVAAPAPAGGHIGGMVNGGAVTSAALASVGQAPGNQVQ